MKLRKLTLVLAAAALLLAQADTTLQKAIRKETVEGDLKGAIELYQKAISQAGKDRATAAQALLRLGDCYEKQGDKQARPAYERLVKEFGDSKEASQAKVKLAAMGIAPGSGRPTTERISEGYPTSVSGMPMDRPLAAFTDWDTGDLMLRDLLTGESRNLTRNGPAQRAKEYAQTSLISADGEMVVYEWLGPSGAWSEIRSIHTDGAGMRTHLRRTPRTEYLSPVALSPDKKTAKVQMGNQLETLSLADNSLKPFADGGRLGRSAASYSPDGKQVVLSVTGPTGESGLFLANADGGGLRPLLTGSTTSPLWTPDGKWIVFVSDRTGSKAVWAIPPSGGDPRLLKEDQGIALLRGFTRDGSLYYSASVNQNDVYVAQLDTATLAIKGAPSQFINTFLGRNQRLNFSPDGKWIVWASARGQAPSVILRAAAGGEEKEMPMPGVTYAHPRIWFPDSKALLNLRRDGSQVIFERMEVPDGRITELYRSAPLRGVPGPPAPVFLFEVSSDGNAVVGYRCDHSTSKPCDLVRYDLQKKSETIVETLSEISDIRSIGLSPDGKQVALIGLSGSGYRLFVRPAPGGTLVELARGTEAEGVQGEIVWTPDSKQIIYAVTAPSGGIWGFKEFRAIPVGGGAPTIIPLKGTLSGLDPGGRLAYTVNSSRTELWVARNLLPSN
jgi:Tol biopolymer transport system component